MEKRKSRSKKSRFEIFKRDFFTCQYCGDKPPKAILEIDHIVALKNGGKDEEFNLVTSCYDCNRGKSSNALSVIPQSLAEKAELIKEKEIQLKKFYKTIQKHHDRINEDAWKVVEELGILNSDRSVDKAYINSIRKFLDKLDIFTLLDAAVIAFSMGFHADRRFRYFCGICNKKIRGE